jgi:hypothetical protein
VRAEANRVRSPISARSTSAVNGPVPGSQNNRFWMAVALLTVIVPGIPNGGSGAGLVSDAGHAR